MSLLVPEDANAERAVVASAVSHPAAYEAARVILGPSAFYHDGRGALFAACEILGDVRWPPCGCSWRTTRIEAIATIAMPWAGDPDSLAAWVGRHAVFVTSGDQWIERVADAWRRRVAMRAALEVFNGLGAGKALGALRKHVTQLGELAA